MNRKKREVFGPNYKWNGEPNYIAYLCFRTNASKETKDQVIHKLGASLSQLDNRIQHFNSLTPESNSTTTKPSKDVKGIYLDHSAKQESECEKELRDFLKSDYHFDEIEEDFNFETEKIDKEENVDEIFQEYWKLQVKYQRYDMNKIAWNDFIKIISTMNIKSRGIKIEKRIIELNKLRKSVMSEQGDAWMDNGDGIEVKTSFITPMIGSSVSITGLRLWEDKVPWYLMVIVDISDVNLEPKTTFLWMPKEKLVEMDEKDKLGTPGMKKSAARGNLNVAKSLRVKSSELEELSKKYPMPDWFKY